MNRINTAVVIVALLPAVATAAEQTPAGQAETKPAKDPEAIAALEKMGAFLRDQQSFTVRTKSQTDHVMGSGQKITISAQGVLEAKRPSHLRADVVSDVKSRQYFYDGKNFTIVSPRQGYYSTVPAPPTTRELIDQLQTKYGLELPLVDLFRWGTNEAMTDQITAASYIGEAKVDGVDTEHYAFRQPGLDWQIWIDKGDKPLPRKLILTTTDNPARPEHSIDLAWSLGVTHNDKEFAYEPPKDAVKIQMAQLGPAPKGEKGGEARRGMSPTPTEKRGTP